MAALRGERVTLVAELPLRGAGGEPVDFARTIVSHGVAELPPNRVRLEARTHETTLPVERGARTVRISVEGATLRIETLAGTFDKRLTKTVAHMFRLDEDLSGFYTLIGEGDLAWCGACFARRRCSRTSSRRREPSYEHQRSLPCERESLHAELHRRGARRLGGSSTEQDAGGPRARPRLRRRQRCRSSQAGVPARR